MTIYLLRDDSGSQWTPNTSLVTSSADGYATLMLGKESTEAIQSTEYAGTEKVPAL